MESDDPIYRAPLPDDPRARQAEIDRRIEAQIEQIVRRRKILLWSMLAGVLGIVLWAGWILLERVSVPERDAASYLTESAKLRAEGNLAAATVQLKLLLRKEPAHIEARWMLAQLHLASGRGADAEKELGNVPVTDANREALQAAMLEARLLARRYGDVACDAPWPCVGPGDPRFAVRAAEAKLGLKALDTVESILRAAGADVSDPAAVEVVRARLELARWRLAAAIAALDGAENLEALLVEGEVELARSDLDAAERAFEAAHLLAPWHPEVQVGRMRVHMGRSRFVEAEQQLKSFSGAARKSSTVQYLVAALAWGRGETAGAVVALRDLLSKEPGHLDGLYLSALINAEKGYYFQAETLLEQLLEMAPQDIAARRLLADVAMKSESSSQSRDGALPSVRPAVGSDSPSDGPAREAIQQAQDSEAQAWYRVAGPEPATWQLGRCRVLVFFCERCLSIRECI